MRFVELREDGHRVADRKYRQFNRLSLNLLNNSRGKTKRESLQSAQEIKAGDASRLKSSLIKAKFETSSMTNTACQQGWRRDTSNSDG